jgi:hypothetical protein
MRVEAPYGNRGSVIDSLGSGSPVRSLIERLSETLRGGEKPTRRELELGV